MANEVGGYIGLSRQTALQRQLDVVSNNIANMNTAGFKAEQSVFQDHLERLSRGSGKPEEQSYVIDKGTYRDLSQGALEATGNPLDVALHGNGWYAYMGDEGVVYGRDGRFLIDEQGRLVTLDGKSVLDVNGAEIIIALDEGNEISVAGDGTLSLDGLALAQIGVSEFDNPHRLERLGNGYFRAPDDEPALPAFNASLVQGMVEKSNVQPIVEMTRMMSLQRAYDQIAKLSDVTSELSSKTITRLGQR